MSLCLRPEKIFKRSFNERNLPVHKFNYLLSQTNWSMFLNEENPNESYNGFVNEYTRIFQLIFQDCFPINIIKGKDLTMFNSPWLTPGLLKSINKKNRLYKQSVRSSSESCKLRYKMYKNKLNHLIRTAKRLYYDNRFKGAKNDLKLTWKLINEVINKRKTKSSLPSSFKSEGRTITDPKEVADSFCKYFSNLGPNLAKAIPAVNYSFRSFLPDNNNTPITLRPTNTEELEEICNKFSSGKSPGYDNTPLHVINNSFHLICAPLVNIINLSLHKGVFLNKLKLAKVNPVYKAEVPNLFVNYSPISLLSNFSKFFEKKKKFTTDLLNLLKRTIYYKVVNLDFVKIIRLH